jgi:hypothetical protein
MLSGVFVEDELETTVSKLHWGEASRLSPLREAAAGGGELEGRRPPGGHLCATPLQMKIAIIAALTGRASAQPTAGSGWSSASLKVEYTKITTFKL